MSGREVMEMMQKRMSEMAIAHNREMNDMKKIIRSHERYHKAEERKPWCFTTMTSETMEVCSNKTVEIKDKISVWFDNSFGKVEVSFEYISYSVLSRRL